MGTKRKKKQISLEHAAKLIEEIAKRVETQNDSFDIQVTISAVEQVLIEMRHLDGLKLVNRIGLLLITKNGKAASNRYGGYVQKQLARTPPTRSHCRQCCFARVSRRDSYNVELR